MEQPTVCPPFSIKPIRSGFPLMKFPSGMADMKPGIQQPDTPAIPKMPEQTMQTMISNRKKTWQTLQIVSSITKAAEAVPSPAAIVFLPSTKPWTSSLSNVSVGSWISFSNKKYRRLNLQTVLLTVRKTMRCLFCGIFSNTITALPIFILRSPQTCLTRNILQY